MEPGVTRGLPSPLGSCLDQPRVDSLWPGLQHVPYPVSRQQPPADCGILRAEQNRSGPSHQGGGFQKMAVEDIKNPGPRNGASSGPSSSARRSLTMGKGSERSRGFLWGLLRSRERRPSGSETTI